ncbi:MAG TPA: helix-turn-helix transcriptional regulator [Spirochaetota bacterium]|nr:helix-turn-helix transcriptional regulator [Spirochaetota bacterium]
MVTTIPFVRRQKKIKQNDMAKALNVSPAYLCKVEKGVMEPTEKFKKQCALYLKSRVNELFPAKVNYTQVTKKKNGNKLWECRQKKGIKQNDMAKMLKCSPSYLSKVEKGHSEPTPEFQKRCSKVLNVKESEIFA